MEFSATIRPLAAALLAHAAAWCAIGAPIAGNAADVDGTRALVERLVDVERELARTRAGWAEERAILAHSRDLLRADLARLRDALAELARQEDHTADRTRELEAERDTHRAASRALTGALAGLEARTLSLVARFPDPLQTIVAPLVRRIPRDPAATQAPLGERVQNLVGILSQADQFNRTVTRRHEVRAVPGEGELEFTVLYWGLAAAYGVDRSGRHATIGRPGPEGWRFEPAPELAGAIQRLIAIQEGRREPDFVPLPLALAR